jgi:hypothetical protein
MDEFLNYLMIKSHKHNKEMVPAARLANTGCMQTASFQDQAEIQLSDVSFYPSSGHIQALNENFVLKCCMVKHFLHKVSLFSCGMFLL